MHIQPIDYECVVILALIEHIPLKQGLKPILVIDRNLAFILIEHIPLKQGLRLYLFPSKANHCSLIEHIPLKQGLRPRTREEK